MKILEPKVDEMTIIIHKDGVISSRKSIIISNQDAKEILDFIEKKWRGSDSSLERYARTVIDLKGRALNVISGVDPATGYKVIKIGIGSIVKISTKEVCPN